ncbi:DUF2087 domain-containing protein [Bradyrhizobium cenepequi]
MSRIPVPFAAGDISALAKSLRGQLARRTSTPSHVELLNMLARSTGYRNYQQFRAQELDGHRHIGRPSLSEPEAVDVRRVERAARYFDTQGRLLRWPARQSLQNLCLWVLWSAFPSRRSLADAEVTAFLVARHAFGDHALLRRSLCCSGLVSRTRDGRDYRRIERKPPAEAAALIRQLKETARGDAQ